MNTQYLPKKSHFTRPEYFPRFKIQIVYKKDIKSTGRSIKPVPGMAIAAAAIIGIAGAEETSEARILPPGPVPRRRYKKENIIEND